MKLFYSILFACVVMLSVLATVQDGIGLGISVFLFLMLCLWLVSVVVDFFIDVGNVLSPSEQTHVHLHVERHPDPTRPSYEDEHPLIILNRNDYNRRKK